MQALALNAVASALPLQVKSMAEHTHWYRAYHLTADGHIARVELVEAVDDLAALRKLETIANGYGIELWDRARVVGKAAPYHPPVQISA